jgi:LysR family transcriptional activator of nhaA
VQPLVVAEFEDLALMKVMAAEGRGFIVLPSVVADEAVRRYGFQIVGKAEKCRVQFHAITAERRIVHPAVALITDQARTELFASSRGVPLNG